MLVRWAPFHDVDAARLFDVRPKESAPFSPPFDVTEDAGKILLEADLPGVAQDALDIQIEQNVLTVKGERRIERAKHESGELYRRYERLSGKFVREFRLPPTVDAEKITASMKDGVLTLLLPKKAESLPRQIKVSVNGSGNASA